jgi:hypothetical protein
MKKRSLAPMKVNRAKAPVAAPVKEEVKASVPEPKSTIYYPTNFGIQNVGMEVVETTVGDLKQGDWFIVPSLNKTVNKNTLYMVFNEGWVSFSGIRVAMDPACSALKVIHPHLFFIWVFTYQQRNFLFN